MLHALRVNSLILSKAYCAALSLKLNSFPSGGSHDKQTFDLRAAEWKCLKHISCVLVCAAYCGAPRSSCASYHRLDNTECFASWECLGTDHFSSVLWKKAVKCRRARSLRKPFALSRLAASKALHPLCQLPLGVTLGAEEKSEWYPDTWEEVKKKSQGTLEISLSHEEEIAGVVAWCTMDNQDSRSPKSMTDAKQLPVRFAVDIVDIYAVQRLHRKYPKFVGRMLPQCATVLPYKNKSLLPFNVTDINNADWCLHAPGNMEAEGTWWHKQIDSDPCEAFSALALAQHWSIRECAIKLVQVPHCSFSYSILQTESVNAALLPVSSSSPSRLLSNGILQPFQVYYSPCVSENGVRQEDRRKKKDVGWFPGLACVTWLEWIPCHQKSAGTFGGISQGTFWKPHVVTVAASPL